MKYQHGQSFSLMPSRVLRLPCAAALVLSLLLGGVSTAAAQEASPYSSGAPSHQGGLASASLLEQAQRHFDDAGVRGGQETVEQASPRVTGSSRKKALAYGLAGAGTVIAGLLVHRGGDDHLNLPGTSTTQETIGLSMIGVGALLGAKGLWHGLSGGRPVPAQDTAEVAAVRAPGALRVLRTAVVLEGPQADASVLGSVGVGEVLEVLDEREDWYLVRPPSEGREWRTGWVNRSTVEGLQAGMAATTTAPQRPPAPTTNLVNPVRSTPAFEVTGGYQFMWDSPQDENLRLVFPAGWFVSGGMNLTSNLSVLGELATSYKSEQEEMFGRTLSANARFLTYLGGVRLRGGSGFVQFLLGGARASVSSSAFGSTISVSETAFAIQPGGGFDIPVSDNVAIRTMIDYRLSTKGGEHLHQVRAAVGAVVGFGER